jgi:general secretion pathway protein G
VSDAPVDPRNDINSGESPAENVGPIAPRTETNSADSHAPRPVQFRISALLIITAVCAALFALPGGICAAPFLLATLGVYVYGVRTGKATAPEARLKMGLVVALLVFVLTIWAGWIKVRNNSEQLDYWVFRIHYDLRHARSAIERYHVQHGEYPKSLEQLPNDERLFPQNAAKEYVDLLGNPVQYHRTPAGYELLSYGRDGKPGGEGVNADLDGKTPVPPPTFQQFAWELQTGRGVPMAAVLTASLAMAMFYAATAWPKGWPQARPGMLFYLVGIVAVSVWIGATMALLYSIPSSH